MAVRQLGSSRAPSSGSVVARPGRIRLFGPLVACLVPAALLAVAAIVWLAWPCDGVACVKPSLAAYGLGMLAVPTAPLSGIPWFLGSGTLAAAFATSAILWLALGRWAAGRATADVDATWRSFWVEFGLLAAAVWAGVVVGLAAIGLWLAH